MKKEIVVKLPRVYKCGSASKVNLTPRILEKAEITKIPEDPCKLARNVLKVLYHDKKLSQSKIAELFGVQRQTVKRWLERLDVPIRKSYVKQLIF